MFPEASQEGDNSHLPCSLRHALRVNMYSLYFRPFSVKVAERNLPISCTSSHIIKTVSVVQAFTEQLTARPYHDKTRRLPNSGIARLSWGWLLCNHVWSQHDRRPASPPLLLLLLLLQQLQPMSWTRWNISRSEDIVQQLADPSRVRLARRTTSARPNRPIDAADRRRSHSKRALRC